MNITDQVVYETLGWLKGKQLSNNDTFYQLLNHLKQIESSSYYLISDTLKLIDNDHDKLLNCSIESKNNQIIPKSNHSNNDWVSGLGELEYQRLELIAS